MTAWITIAMLVGCREERSAKCQGGGVLSDGSCAPPGCTAPAGATATVAGGGAALAEALAVAQAGEVLAIEPGTYDGAVDVPTGVTIAGWCATGVVLTADYRTANLDIDIATGVVVSDLTLRGGAPGVYVSGDVGQEVSLDGVVVEDAGSYGVRVAGAASVSLEDCEVAGTLEASDGTGGRGLVAQGGAIVRATESRFVNNVEAGLLVDGSRLDLEDVEVLGTRATSGGRFGRGIQAQNGATLRLAGASRVEDSGDAGICVLGSEADLAGVTVRGTRGTGEVGGDAVAVFGGGSRGPARLALRDSSLEENERAAVMLDGAEATFEGEIRTTGNVYSIVSQGGASPGDLGPIHSEGDEQERLDQGILEVDDEPMQ